MKQSLIVAAVFALATPLSAFAAGPDPKIFDLVVHSESFNGSQVLTSRSSKSRSTWQSLATVEMSVPSVIQLDGEVPANIQAKVGIGGKTPLPAGTILYASGSEQTIYCTPARSIVLDMMGAPCLIDTDNDGRFDDAAKSNNSTWQPDALVMSNSDILTVSKKYIMGVALGAPIHLPIPIPYHTVDNATKLQVLGDLSWASNYGFNGAGPVQVMLAYRLYVDGSGGGLFSPPQRVTLTGKPTDVYMDGITVTITGIGPDGVLNYTLNGKAGDDATTFAFFQNAIISWPPN